MKYIFFVLFSVVLLMAPHHAQAACTSPSASKGAINYDSAGNRFEYCDNSSWVNMTKGGELTVLNITDNSGTIDNPQHFRIRGNYAFVLSSSTVIKCMVIVDISDPENMTKAGSVCDDNLSSSDYIDVDAAGDYAYIVNGNNNNSLTVIDATNKSAPSVLTIVDDPTHLNATIVASVSGSYLYAYSYSGSCSGGCTGHLSIYNITDPSNPVFTGATSNLATTYYPYDIKITGNKVLWLKSTELTIIDVTNKAAPSIQGTYTNSSVLSNAKQIAVTGSYAYVTSASGQNIAVFNISGSTPSLVTTVQTDSNVTISSPVGIDISGTYAYTYNANNISVLDVTTPASPVTVGKFIESFYLTTPSETHESGGYLFSLSPNKDALVSSDLSTKKLLKDQEWIGKPLNTVSDIVVNGSYAYVIDGKAKQLYVYNVSGNDPVVVGKTPSDVRFSFATSLDYYSGYVYVLTKSTNPGLTVVNVSTPSNPTIVTQITDIDITSAAHQIKISGTYAYMMMGDSNSGSGRLTIASLSSPTAPSVVGTATGGYNNDGIAIVGNTLYSMWGQGACCISSIYKFDITTKSAPSFIGTSDVGSTYLRGGLSLITDGTYLYIGNSYSTCFLSVIDVSSTPTGVATLDNKACYRDLKLSGNYLYGISPNYTIDVINKTTPTNPTYTTSAYTSIADYYGIMDIDSTGNNAYIVDTNPAAGAILIDHIDFTNKSNALSLSTSVTNTTYLGGCYDGYTQGNYLYVPCYNSDSLAIINISSPGSPSFVGGVADATNLDCARSVVVDASATYAYVGTCSSKLVVVNIATKSAPYIFTTIDDITNINYVSHIERSGNYIYLGNVNLSSFSVYDISVPSAPSFVSQYANTTYTRWPYDFRISGTTLINQGYYTLATIDISNPASLTPLDYLYDSASFPYSNSRMALYGNYVIVSYGGKISIADISDPSDISVVTTYQKPGIGSNSISITGSTLYTVGSTYIGFVDLSTISDPQLTGVFSNTLDLPASAYFGKFIGSYFYVTNSSSSTPGQSIYVMSTNGTTTPISVGTATVPNELDAPYRSFFHNNYLYVATSASDNVTVFDVSDASDMKNIATIENPGYMANINAITASGNYLYVLDNAGYLTVVNITTPSSPSIATTFTDSHLTTDYAMAISGNYLYSVGDGEINILNISTPSSPSYYSQKIDAVSLNEARDIKIQGSYAYIVGEFFVVADISSPALPVLKAQKSFAPGYGSGPGTSVTLKGSYAYAFDSYLDAVYVYDISTPTAPSEVTVLDDAAFLNDSGILASGASSTLYVYGSTSHSAAVVDISTPSAPVVTQSYLNGGGSSYGVYDMQDNGSGDVFMICYNYDSVFSAIEDNAPIPGKINDIYLDGNQIDNPRDMVRKGNYLYVASTDSSAINVIDISDPEVPVLVASLIDPVQLEQVTDIDVKGDYLLAVSSSTSNRYLTTIDISNPLAPYIANRYYNTTYFYYNYDIDVVGDYAYTVSSQSDRLGILDVSDPLTPVPVAYTTNSTTMNCAQGVDVNGNYAYVTSSCYQGIQIVDVSNPASPVQMGAATNTNMNGAKDIKVIGNYAYVSAPTASKLSIVDISEKAAPVYLSSVGGTQLTSIQNIQLIENIIYAAGLNNDYFSVIDVSNVNSPVIQDYIQDNTKLNGAYGIYIYNGYAYVTSIYADTLTVIDLNPSTTTGPCSLEGALRYNSAQNVLEFCDSQGWVVTANIPGAGGAGCAAQGPLPAAPPGTIQYDSSTDILTFCDGTNWSNIQ